MRLLFGMAVVIAALLGGAAVDAAPRVITHPYGEVAGDPRAGYPIAVLREALTAAGYPHRLAAFPAAAPQERNFRLLESGHLDVLWSMATDERMVRVVGIPYPIDFGLLGWRALLVREDDVARFRGVDGIEDLAAFVGVQGHDWPDGEILQGNGLAVVTGTEYPGLFDMLRGGRADYFPRSVSEAERERQTPQGRGLAVAPGLILHYRAPLIFFVQRNDPALAHALTEGLLHLKRTGRLEQLFLDAYRDDVNALKTAQTRTIELDNPLLRPGVFPVDDTWLRPPSP